MTSYLSENEAENLQMATSILLKFLTLKSNISRTIWRIEVSDGSFFWIFYALSFGLNLFRPEFPFKKFIPKGLAYENNRIQLDRPVIFT